MSEFEAIWMINQEVVSFLVDEGIYFIKNVTIFYFIFLIIFEP